MFDLSVFLKGLDEMYADRRAQDAEAYLVQGLSSAVQEGQKGAALAVLNELIGYYRVFNRYDKCEACIREALFLAEELGLKGTVNYATTLLNAATAYRAAGRLKEALAYYLEADGIYGQELLENDYRRASLNNNIGILYQELGDLERASRAFEKALAVISGLDNNRAELATTHTNIALLCFRRQDEAGAESHLKQALSLFEGAEGVHDPHYGAALAGMGEACCRMRKFNEGIHAYERALEEIEACYGRNEYYRITAGNLEAARKMAGILQGE